jgi:hypothetical protein
MIMTSDPPPSPISDEILLRIIDEYDAEQAAAVIRAINGTPEPVQPITPRSAEHEESMGWPAALVRTAFILVFAWILNSYLKSFP